MSRYKIEIILDKPEISTDYQIICWSEVFEGKKKDAVKLAKKLQKEWKAELYSVNKI